MAISASYEKKVEAKLYVHVQGDEPIEATEEDLAKFGYFKVAVEDKAEAAEEAEATAPRSEFDFTPFLQAGVRFGSKAVKAAGVVKDVTVTIIKDKVNDSKNTK
jgi:hypothetical protein